MVQGMNDKQAVSTNSKVVDSLLFTQVSCSAVASHKWTSATAKQKILSMSVISPNLDHYPLSPRVSDEIKQIQKQCTPSLCGSCLAPPQASSTHLRPLISPSSELHVSCCRACSCLCWLVSVSKLQLLCYDYIVLQKMSKE